MGAKTQQFLVIYSSILSSLFAVMVLTGAKPAEPKKFDQITVQRINIGLN